MLHVDRTLVQPCPRGNGDASPLKEIQSEPMVRTASEVPEGRFHDGTSADYPAGGEVSGTCDPGLAANAKPHPTLKWFRPSEKDVAVLRRALLSCYTAGGLIFWISTRSPSRRKVYRKTLFRVLGSILTEFSRNAFALIGRLKAFAFHCREISFGSDPNPSILGVVLPRFARTHFLRSSRRDLSFFQLSFLGRALPMGPDHVQAKAIRSFADNTLEDFPTRGSDGHSIVMSFLTHKSLDTKVPSPSRVKFNFHSPGATATCSRKNGGFESEIRSLIVPLSRNSAYARGLWDASWKGLLTNWKLAVKFVAGLPFAHRSGASGFMQRNLQCIPFPPPSTGRIVSIPEYGWKARAVQALDVKSTFYGHLHRQRLWPLLEGFPQIRQGLKPDDTITFRDCLPNRNRLWYSMDLSNATDLIGRDILKDMCTFFGIPTDTVFVSELETRKGFKFPVNRGTSMGAPCSWIMLSLIHYSICRFVSGSGGDFVIRGDDLAAYWTQEQYSLYCTLMSQVGFKINLKKCFVNASMFTFCERLYHVSDGIATDHKLVLSIRRFSRLPSDRDGRESFSKDGLSDDLPSVTGIRESSLRPGVRRSLIRMVKRTLPMKGSVFDFLCEIPSCLGGLGLNPKLNDSTLNLLAWFMLGEESKFALSSCLQTRTQKARAFLETQFKTRYLIRQYQYGPRLPVTDAEEALSCFMRRMDLALFMGEDSSLDELTNRSLWARMKTWQRSIRSFSERKPSNFELDFVPSSVEELEYIVNNSQYYFREGMEVLAVPAATGTYVEPHEPAERIIHSVDHSAFALSSLG